MFNVHQRIFDWSINLWHKMVHAYKNKEILWVIPWWLQIVMVVIFLLGFAKQIDGAIYGLQYFGVIK